MSVLKNTVPDGYDHKHEYEHLFHELDVKSKNIKFPKCAQGISRFGRNCQ